ncbi:scarecrow-like protein 8 [Cornus florida]|uniref:scarecrow-like protein 8 n=1 Tax=Cornus florida TaxID=4283 RepID=UPI00289E046C|nr:scarecrow-like protein 8 [Cornus florida]
MSSGFSGEGPGFYTAGGISGRSISMNNSQIPYRSQLAGVLADPSSQILHRQTDLIGKRSLAEFQIQQHHQLPLYQQQQHPLYQQQQQQQSLGLYLRHVKARTYQHTSPISPLSPIDFSASISPETTPTTISSSSSRAMSSARYGLPILQQLRPQPINPCNGNGIIPSSANPNFSSASYPNLAQNRVASHESVGQESEKKMMYQLQEIEKQLLDDSDDEEGDTVSVITNSEWSETIQSLISPGGQKPISPSPTSSSSSCSSSSASPPTVCPKQSLMDAASAISEGKTEAATEILTRLSQISNPKGTSEQRLTAYMASALRSRVNPTEYPPPAAELYGKDHTDSTQMLYEVSPCFKLGFMAANLAILEAISQQKLNKLHVVDFDIGQGGQYKHLIHALAAKKGERISLKITTFMDFANGSEERLRMVGEGLKAVANKDGVCLNFSVLSLKICDLSLQTLGVESDEVLAVNFAFLLYKLPDESVTTDNMRDEMLRRVKGLAPAVVTVVEQEMNANTAPFVARVSEACGYFGALFDSLDSTLSKDKLERVKIEEGLGRKAANSVACEGRDRVERCEVFGKWRARMGMAGFKLKPLSQSVAESLRFNSGTRFNVKEETGGIGFGWMGRTLTVASAWI